MVVLGPCPRPAEGTRHARGPGPVGARVTRPHRETARRARCS